MSRIGKQPVPVPDNIQVKITKRLVNVTGPGGTLEFEQHPQVTVKLDQDAKALVVTRCDDTKFSRSLHGLTRALLANMVTGVLKGFEKVVLLEGIGYAASVKGRDLVLNVGYARPVTLQIPDGVKVETPSAQRMIFTGADKQIVNDFAAQTRLVRKADPYHQKGMRYEGEVVRRKVGKAFASGPA